MQTFEEYKKIMTGFQGVAEEEEIEYESIPNSSLGVNMLAGAFAGITEHVATYPLDVLKTRMQFSTSVSGNVMSFMSQVYSKEGLMAFSRGLNSVILSAGPAHALYFGAYEACKETFVELDKSEHKHLSHASAGIIATMFHDGLVTPFDVVKQRMQLSESWKGVFDTGREIYRKEGFRAFYISYPVTLIMSIPFQAIQFTTYEYGRKKLNPKGDYNPMSHCIAGGIAGAVASLATNPLDVAKTMLQTRGLATDNAIRHVSGLHTAFRAIYSRYGAAGFARGIQARMLSNIPSTAVAWTTYEFLKMMMLS